MQQNKHDHKFTNKLKVIIFAMFLLLPFLTMLPNAIYYAFNDNATNSHIETTTINYKYETNEVNSIEDLVDSNAYKISIDLGQFGYGDLFIEDSILCVFNSSIMNTSSWEYDSVGAFKSLNQFIPCNYFLEFILSDFGYLDFVLIEPTIDFSNTNNYLMSIYAPYLYPLNGDIVDLYIIYKEDYVSFDFSEISFDVDSGLYITECPKEYIPIESVDTTTQEMTITENLQYEFEKQWLNNPLFNWTQNNPIKQPINQFVNIFGIEQNTPLTNYLTYMISFIGIYIIFDIIIELFTFLTHLLTSKNTN